MAYRTKILYKTLLKLTDTAKTLTLRDSLLPHRHTHTHKDSVIKSTQSKMTNMTNKGALTNTNTPTSTSGYTDTTLSSANKEPTNRNSQWHLKLPCQGRCACVCVCAVTDTSRMPLWPLSELARTYGGVPRAASKEDWWFSQVLIDEPA